MVLKRSVKRKRRNRRKRRSLQKGAGYSFKLDCNLPGGVPEVVTYKNCGTPQADLAPPADSQLAPGQAPAEVVGVSNDNLSLVQQAQAPQQAVQQAQQTGGKRSRRRRRRKINILRGGVQPGVQVNPNPAIQGDWWAYWTMTPESGIGSVNNEILQQLINQISPLGIDELSDDIFALQHADTTFNNPLDYFNNRLSEFNESLANIEDWNASGDLQNNRYLLYKQLMDKNIEATTHAKNRFLEDNPPAQNGGRSRRRRRRRRRSNRKPRKSLRRRRRKTIVKRRRRRRRQSGGDLNCPNCNMSTRTFGCRQPLWDAKCI